MAARAPRCHPRSGLRGRAPGATPPAVIAEVKRASPSAGRSPRTRPRRARPAAYEAAGAAAISVLTEPTHFHGSLADLRAVRIVACSIPVLRKDFLVHPAQLIESRACGSGRRAADRGRALATELDGACSRWRRDLGLGALVETHSDEDLGEGARDGRARWSGVNARDLETLEVDVERALARLGRIAGGPRSRCSRAGSRPASTCDAAVDAGASAILVGEALMRADDPGATLRELLGRESCATGDERRA